MDLFVVENSVAVPSTHALLIYPFKQIWDRDNTPHKAQAICEFTYIELMCSMKKSNPFSGYSEDMREKKVANNIFPNLQQWLPDSEVVEAMKVYRALQEETSPTLRIIASAQRALRKIEEFLNEVDFKERTRTNGAVYKPQDVAATVKMLPETRASLNKMREEAEQELNDNSKTRGQREINHYEE